MTAKPTPSRLPRAFVRVSKCPICGYSLKDIDDDLPCPECGSEIDRDLLTSPEMHDAVRTTKIWCILAVIGWSIFGFGYLAYNMVSFSVKNFYHPGTYGPIHYAAVWLTTGAMVALIVLSCLWYRHTRREIYRFAIRRSPSLAEPPKRVVAAGLAGVLLGLVGCLGIIGLISAV